MFIENFDVNDNLFSNTVGSTDFISAIGLQMLPSVFGKLLSSNIEDEEDDALIQCIPTETTYSERKLYYNFFKYLWQGRHDVLEVGPFLGGTTRSIALGMSKNIMIKKNAKLHTIDKFENYNIKLLEKILDLKLFNENKREKLLNKLNNDSDFESIFDELHADCQYNNIINKIKGGLPDIPNNRNHIDLYNVLKGIKLECVFVDGCKSWYSTKYLLKYISCALVDNGYLIFQDYGWYTCFWIPFIISKLNAKLTLIASVDTTYIFKITDTLKENDFEAIPNDPKELEKIDIESTFEKLLYDSAKRNDYNYLVIGRIHLAGALAYCGYKLESKKLLQSLLLETFAADFRDIIKNALVSPTYSPTNGEILL